MLAMKTQVWAPMGKRGKKKKLGKSKALRYIPVFLVPGRQRQEQEDLWGGE